MSDRSAKGCLLAALLWCLILGVLGVGYRWLVHPYLFKKLERQTGSASRYKEEIVLAADSFSGYCLLRSDIMKADLQARGIRLSVKDDQGDYAARLKALREGRAQLAAFTIDSLLTASAAAGEFPGSIVLVLDETKGGDAIVAYQQGVGSVQDLNDPTARLVLTPNSPSEFLARVIIATFNLPRLPAQWSVPADGAAAVHQMLLAASPRDKRAFVLWEPFVSMALRQPGVHVLLDSSNVRGFIVDVLVARREFLRDRPEAVRAVVEAYSRAAYSYQQRSNALVQLVRDDVRLTGGPPLDLTQSEKIIQGIQWKNTLENYAHFGLVPASDRGGLPLMEDMIANIVEVLVKTKALASDPLGGQYHTLFHDRILAEMKQAGFHPSQALPLPGVSPAGSAPAESVRADEALLALSDAQWQSLRPVGELKIEPIAFLRGSAEISTASDRELTPWAARLAAFPRFYIRVVGQTRSEGDPDANRRLAQARADAVTQLLISRGVPAQRIRSEAAPSLAAGGEAQAVSLVVGQMPY